MTVLMVATVVAVGLLVGVELSVSVVVNPILDRLPGTAGLAGRTEGARMLGRAMPFCYSGAIVLALLWAVLGRVLGQGAAVVAAVGAAAAVLVVAIVLSIVFLVPVNDRVRAWSEGDAPADWRDQVARWDRWHVLRTALLVVAFAAVVVGLASA